MNKLNRKVEYSLIALKHMSQKASGELTTAKEVAEKFHAPFDATARVLQMMANQGLLKSEQGVNGGYILNRDLQQISLKELIDIIQGPTKITRCMHQGESDDGPCEIQGSCNIISPVENLNQRLNGFYQSITLRDLLAR